MVTTLELKQQEKALKKVVTITRSICPECNRILPAEVFEENNKI